MTKRHRHSTAAFSAACLAVLLTLPLAACGERPDEEPEAEQPGTLEMARDKEAERRSGAGTPELDPGDTDYTDEYSEPRESWTGEAPGEGAFTDVAVTDARAESALREALAAHEGMSGVEVEVTDGIVHLTGEVDSMVARREAEDIGMAIEGVVEVRNDLQAPTMGQ